MRSLRKMLRRQLKNQGPPMCDFTHYCTNAAVVRVDHFFANRCRMHWKAAEILFHTVFDVLETYPSIVSSIRCDYWKCDKDPEVRVQIRDELGKSDDALLCRWHASNVLHMDPKVFSEVPLEVQGENLL